MMDKQLPWLYLLKQIRMMAVVYREITDVFICSSVVLQMLTESARQGHVEYELGISHSQIMF